MRNQKLKSLILLDIVLPKLDDISLCRQLRQAGYQNMPLTKEMGKMPSNLSLDRG